MERAERVSIRDVLLNHSILGTMIITLACCTIIISQGWGTGAFFLAIPVCLGCFAIFFDVLAILKPNTNIAGVAMFQHPYGDEAYMHGVFFVGYIMNLLLTLVIGYEAKLAPDFFQPVFKIISFVMTVTYVSCFHVAINKAWLTARIELFSEDKNSKGPVAEADDGHPPIAPLPRYKRHTLWCPAQEKFELFTIANILLYICLVVLCIIDLVNPLTLNAFAITLPGTGVSGPATGYIGLSQVVSSIVSAAFFVVVLRTLFRETYNYNLEHLSGVLVKLEPDDATRERIIKFLERVHDQLVAKSRKNLKL